VQALETTPVRSISCSGIVWALPIKSCMVAMQHRATCPTPSSEGCVYCQAEGTLLNMWNRERRAQPMAPRWLAQNIKMLGRQFRVGRQARCNTHFEVVTPSLTCILAGRFT
jgi:hypothetical protein